MSVLCGDLIKIYCINMATLKSGVNFLNENKLFLLVLQHEKRSFIHKVIIFMIFVGESHFVNSVASKKKGVQ